MFVGHSVAGTELSKLGAAYPDRVKKLVYLDALEFGVDGQISLNRLPPEFTAAEMESVQRFAAASALFDGYRQPLAAIRNMIRTDASGRVIDRLRLPKSLKIQAGLQPAEYDLIQAPALGIFVPMTLEHPFDFYWYLDHFQQAEYERVVKVLIDWQKNAFERWRGIELAIHRGAGRKPLCLH